MSELLPFDISVMHTKFGFYEKVDQMNEEKLKALLEFRIKFLEEEIRELREAVESNNHDDIVDAHIDLCVVAIGTLDLFDVDVNAAWNTVHEANMAKQAGIKEGRPNPLGLPDLMKPEGWTAPSHADNIGLLEKLK